MAMRVVYVHGAGRQENRDLLKRRLDQHLFGSNQLGRTSLAYYADVVHLEPELPEGLEAPETPDEAAIRLAFESRAMEVAAAERRELPVSSTKGTEEMPDPAFLLLARIASRDVTDYLVHGKADAMREPVRNALRAAGSPLIVIAHSLGTIVTFDALQELGSDAPEVSLLLTVGSPLGISNVLSRLVKGTPPPPPIPSTVKRWVNVADRFDPVVLVPDLSPRFAPTGSISDHTVDNRALLNHDLTGYLDTSFARTSVRAALSVDDESMTTEDMGPQPASMSGPAPDLAAAIRSARTHAAQLMALPNVVAVRGGYKFVDGRITDTAAVVVAVDRKLASVPDLERIPAILPDGIPTDVTIADPIERLAASGELEAVGGPALQGPQPLLIDELQSFDAETIELEALTPITYLPPPGASLDPVTGPMAVTCHVSPDAGWAVLRPFLQGAQDEITLGMYDFTAPHVFETARALLAASGVEWQQTLGPHESLPKPGDDDSTKEDDKPESVVNAALADAAPTRFESTFAHVGKNRTFASAYHIKVAVRDRVATWLSSGNWQSSNQPSMDFQDPAAERALMPDYNRDWHIVVESAPLAETFRRYLRHDFDTASTFLEGVAVEPELPDLLVPVGDELEAAAPVFDVFAPQRFEFAANDPLTIQPILTPDNYVEVVLALLRERPQRRLYFQNQSLNPINEPTPEWTELLSLLAASSRDPSLDVRIIFRDIFLTRKKIESIKAAGFDMDRVRVQVNCHTKGIIIDSETVLIGSHNWTNQGVQANRDASLLIRRPEIAQYYERIFLHDWDKVARSTIDEEAMPVPAGTDGVLNEAAAPVDGRSFRRVSWASLVEES
jgi:phosphatidylserine/phosphatidylglycerophosphate/cardiolipin synthase-like enzyme